MASIFSKIIAGEIPGRFVYRDDSVVAFLDISPITYGHTLVVPVQEVNKWTDLDAETWAHLNEVAQRVGQALIKAFGSERAGYIIAGFDVPHTHIHCFPTNQMADYNFANTIPEEQRTDEKMDEAARRIREALGVGPDGRA